MLTTNEGGSIANNVGGNGWGCRFLRVATKAIWNGKVDANENLQDNAATGIFSTSSELMDTKIDPRGGTFNNQITPNLNRNNKLLQVVLHFI